MTANVLDAQPMDTDDQTGEVFEIGDFTVVTPMEHFVTLIESALQDWELTGKKPLHIYNKNVMKNVAWATKSKILKFHDRNQIFMTHYHPILPDGSTQEANLAEDRKHFSQPSLDMSSAELDFVPQNNIVSMFGVCEFVVFSPFDPVEDLITTEDNLKYITSAFRVAAQDHECSIPMFVQFRELQCQLYFGVSIDNGMATHFESARLQRGQLQHMNLSGLIAMFKQQIKCPTICNLNDIRVSVQFEFEQKKLSKTGMINPDSITVPFKLDRYAVGSEHSPLEALCLIAAWPNHCEDVLIENSVYSDLDPQNAFEWSVYARFESMEGEMVAALVYLLEIQDKKIGEKTSKEVFGIEESSVSAFSQLTDTGSARNIQFGSSSITNPGGLNSDFALMPLDDEEMDRWINAIFRMTNVDDEFEQVMDANLREKLKGLSNNSISAPFHSVAGRIARAFYHLSMNKIHPKNAHVQMWIRLVKALRRRYDNGEDVVDKTDLKEPNLLRCFFNQKLEMLQCCVNARRLRHQLYDSAKQFGQDEFFDAEEDISSRPVTPVNAEDADSNGRLDPHGDMKLFDHPGTPLYNFVTQNACPMTEDMAQAHQEYLEKLDEHGRVLAQLASLRSDMQAFKAANPLGAFCDFIRWHSPKDWIEEESRVSDRFLMPDNVWLKCWEEANPVPVVSQARLFNETAVAEEILSMFESASMANISDWLKPIVFMGSARQLLERGWKVHSLFDSDRLISAVTLATRTKRRDDYLEALLEIKKTERSIMFYESIQHALRQYVGDSLIIKAPTEEQLTQFAILLILDWRSKYDNSEMSTGTSRGLLVSKGVPIVGAASSSLGDTIRKAVLHSQATTDDKGHLNMPLPFNRQYVLRWLAPQPGIKSRMVPQRMFASIGEEFRIAGSFTQDTLFR